MNNYTSLTRSSYKLKYVQPKPGIHTKFGGIPDVPKDFIWPANNSMQYLFIMQINCEELNQDFYEAGFPATGVLSIFLPCFESDLDENPNYNDIIVFYFQELTKLKPARTLTYSYQKRIEPPIQYSPPAIGSSDDMVLDYLAKLREELRTKKIQEFEAKKAKIGDREYETITKDLILLDEFGIDLVPVQALPDPYLYSKQYAKLENKTDLTTQESEKIKHHLTQNGVEDNDHILGWPVGYQGLSEDITQNPDEWINLFTLVEEMDRFFMYEGHLPSSITAVIRHQDLKSLKLNRAVAFQDWD